MAKKFLHQDPEFKTLIQIVASEQGGLNPFMVEKDYWIMHCLWGLQNQGLDFELKGGTSLSKGYKIINRFSEDIDLKIIPPSKLNVKSGKNHDKPVHMESRKNFFDWLAKEIKIFGITVSRENEFDDVKFRNAGISLRFQPLFEEVVGIKPAVLLETGFDDTTPNTPITISSWVFDKAYLNANFNYIDNRAAHVKCYVPRYTFVEKLQAVATKYRQFKDSGKIEKNFMRHYYDIYCLLGLSEIKNFIGSVEYKARMQERFRKIDEPEKLNQNPAFTIQSKKDFEILNTSYRSTADLYYRGQPNLKDIFERLDSFRDQF